MAKEKIEDLRDPALAEMRESTEALFEERETGKKTAARLLREERAQKAAEAIKEKQRAATKEKSAPIETLEPEERDAILRWAKAVEKHPELAEMFKLYTREQTLKSEGKKEAGTMRVLPPRKPTLWDKLSRWLNW